MKIFKTFLWTSLFWILVIAGLWIASIFFPHEASTVIHQNVKNAIIENANIECAVDNWIQKPVKVDEEIVDDVVYEEPVYEESQVPVAEETSSPLFSVQQGSVVDVQALQNRVENLENEYTSLVSELQQIFSTPALAELLAQPSNSYEPQNQVYIEE